MLLSDSGNMQSKSHLCLSWWPTTMTSNKLSIKKPNKILGRILGALNSLITSVAYHNIIRKEVTSTVPLRKWIAIYLIDNNIIWNEKSYFWRWRNNFICWQTARWQTDMLAKRPVFSVFTMSCNQKKIVTIQWKKSRVWDTIDDWYINNLAKNQVSAIFHSHVICRALYGDAMFVSLEIQTCSITIRTLSSCNIVKRQVPIGSFIW